MRLRCLGLSLGVLGSLLSIHEGAGDLGVPDDVVELRELVCATAALDHAPMVVGAVDVPRHPEHHHLHRLGEGDVEVVLVGEVVDDLLLVPQCDAEPVARQLQLALHADADDPAVLVVEMRDREVVVHQEVGGVGTAVLERRALGVAGRELVHGDGHAVAVEVDPENVGASHGSSLE